jgi:hypothetical protein
MFPIPPRYAPLAAATALLTVAVIALLQVHSFAGVLAAATSSAILLYAIEVLRKAHQRAG